MIGESAHHTLLYPPGSIGGKPEPFIRIKSLHSFHQSHTPFLDQIQEGQTQITVSHSYFCYQTQVSFHHSLFCLADSPLIHSFPGDNSCIVYYPKRANFLFRVQQWYSAYLAEIYLGTIALLEVIRW